MSAPDDEPCIHLLDPATCTMCNGREERERRAATTVAYTMTARYDSTLGCGHAVEVGDEFAVMSNGLYKCSDCAPSIR